MENKKNIIEKRMKKGLSAINVVLIIFLVIIFAGIIFIITNNFVKSNKLDIGASNPYLEIKSVKVDGENVTVVVLKKESEPGEFIGLNFIFSNSTDSETIRKNITMNESEQRSFTFVLTKISASTLKGVLVAPIYSTNSGKESPGENPVIFSINNATSNFYTGSGGGSGGGGSSGGGVSDSSGEDSVPEENNSETLEENNSETLEENVSGDSMAFPSSTSPPTVADFLPSPVAIRYCSPSGNNTLGDGSINNPWYDLIGASNGGTGSPVVPGTIIYFRGGTYNTYPYFNFALSQNRLTVSGTAGLPIVITNYPNEIAVWNDTDETWALTLNGNYQKMIGTKTNSGEYGFKIQGGISVTDDYQRVSGVEFIGGTYNGGDGNPGMLSVPINDGGDHLVVSHNIFRNSKNPDGTNRITGFRTFTTTNLIVEYNLFANNTETYTGIIIFKDNTDNAIVRYNKFINSEEGISFFTQGADTHDNNEIHHNLFYNVTNPFVFVNELGSNITIHDNVALAIPADGGFLYYLNADNVYFPDSGDYYNNVIDGLGFEKGWATVGSNDLKNIPDFFDYNLWYDSSDRNDPFSSVEFPPATYHQNDVISLNAVIYNSTSQTAKVNSDYAGLGQGRYGSNIGGFEWT